MKPAGHTPDHHHSQHRRLSQVCMPRVGMAQIGWGLPRFDEWIERARAARDHLLASPRFRRWAAEIIQICAEQDMRLRSTPLPLAAAARATCAVRG